MSRRSWVRSCLFLMLCMCRPVLSRFLILVCSVLFRDRLERADRFAGVPFFRSNRSFARSLRVCGPVLVRRPFIRCARSCARSPETCRPVLVGLPFFVQLDIVRGRRKLADLYSQDFLFSSARSCAQIAQSVSFDSSLVEFQTCCVVFQYDHPSVTLPQEIHLRCVLHTNGAQNL